MANLETRVASLRRIASLEEMRAASLAQFEECSIAEAARSFAIALSTGDYWWVGFAYRCVDTASADVRIRCQQLAEAVAGAIEAMHERGNVSLPESLDRAARDVMRRERS